MKDQKKIRLGLIGVGNWAMFAHVRVLRLLPEYEIGVCAPGDSPHAFHPAEVDEEMHALCEALIVSGGAVEE